MRRLLAVTVALGLIACGDSPTNTVCSNRICGDYCDACAAGSGATCQLVQGICDASGACRIGFDPNSTDPAACRPCKGQSCAQFQ